MMLMLKKFFQLKMYVWVAVAIILVAGGFGLFGYFSGQADKATISQSYSSVKYLEEVHEVVLLNVGIQRVESKKTNTKIPWTEIGIPATEKRALIVLNYEAKLGITKPVSISKSGDNAITVKVPKFEVIGVELDEKNPYQLYDDSGDLLSFATEKIDTAELALKKLSNKDQNEYLISYQDNLKRSAETYYKSIITAINPEFEVTVTFAD